MSSGQRGGHTVLIAATIECTRRKRDGFPPRYLPIYPWFPFREMDQVINSWLDETPQFSCPSIDLTKTITEQPSIIKSGQWGRWLGDHHHEHHGQIPMSVFCPLAELSFLPFACACLKQCAFEISVWAGVGVSWSRLSWTSPQLSSQQCQAQVTSKSAAAPSPAWSILPGLPPWLLCVYWGSSAFPGERGCKPQIPLKGSQWLCQNSTSVSVQKSKPLNRPAHKQSHHSFYTTLFKHDMRHPRKDWAGFPQPLLVRTHWSLPDRKISPCNLASHDTSP